MMPIGSKGLKPSLSLEIFKTKNNKHKYIKSDFYYPKKIRNKKLRVKQNIKL